MLNISSIRTALKTSRSAFRPALGAQIAPALIRGVHATPATAQQQEKEKLTHTSDTYAKEVDSTPAADNTVHRVDPDSDCVQKPYEPPSGYSRAGVQYEEYRHVEGRKQPYAPEGGSKGNYGARPDWAEQKGPETSGPEESPNERSSRGRQ